MKPSEVLTKAKELLLKEENWTRDAYARNKEGVNVPLREAHCRCLLGAVLTAEGYRNVSSGVDWDSPALIFLKKATVFGIATFNDDMFTTHQDVLNALDKAIALAKEAENEAQRDPC